MARAFPSPPALPAYRRLSTARHTGDDVRLTVTDAGTGTARLRVENAYGGRSRTFAVRPGTTVRHTVDLAGSRRWYDVTVTSESGPAFLRRFAGHVENGRPGVSDPAIVTD